MSANGNVPAGAIKETEQAKKVWLCLNSTKAGLYLPRDTAAGGVVEYFGDLADKHDEPKDFKGYEVRLRAGDF